jgi:hypothetical protein
VRSVRHYVFVAEVSLFSGDGLHRATTLASASV